MNRYIYECFEIPCNNVSEAINGLIQIGSNGWHVYRQTSHKGKIVAWACKKTANKSDVPASVNVSFRPASVTVDPPQESDTYGSIKPFIIILSYLLIAIIFTKC